ncbi:hypothetical protein C8R45DRAFT_1078559, partial [Mycena sanguinolenta]
MRLPCMSSCCIRTCFYSSPTLSTLHHSGPASNLVYITCALFFVVLEHVPRTHRAPCLPLVSLQTSPRCSTPLFCTIVDLCDAT